MAFLDKMNQVAKNLGEKAGEAVEQGKTALKVQSEKSAIEEAQKKIGEIYYNAYKNGLEIVAEALPLCQEIDKHNAEIQAAQAGTAQPQAAPAQAAPAAGGKFCPNCGTKVEGETKFCSNCGSAV